MYKGYIEVVPTQEEHASLYQAPENNIFNCLTNPIFLFHQQNHFSFDDLL